MPSPAAAQNLSDWSPADPAARPMPRRRRPWLRGMLTALACVGGLSYLALLREPDTPAPSEAATSASAADAALAPTWQDVPPREAVYTMEAGPARDTGLRRDSRRHVATGSREDVFSSGAFDDSRAHFVLSAERGSPVTGGMGLFVELARRAAPLGLAILRMGQPDTLQTKFGEVEAAPVTLSGTSERGCMAFRRADPESGFALFGWHCAADPRPTRESVVCLIDRLRLAPGDDPVLRGLFERAEARRSAACGTPAPHVASRGRAG